jgi:hypothetical protein
MGIPSWEGTRKVLDQKELERIIFQVTQGYVTGGQETAAALSELLPLLPLRDAMIRYVEDALEAAVVAAPNLEPGTAATYRSHHRQAVRILQGRYQPR